MVILNQSTLSFLGFFFSLSCVLLPFPHHFSQSIGMQSMRSKRRIGKKDQHVNCSNKRNTSKHLFVRRPQKVCQTPEPRDTTFPLHKQRCSKMPKNNKNNEAGAFYLRVLRDSHTAAFPMGSSCCFEAF